MLVVIGESQEERNLRAANDLLRIQLKAARNDNADLRRQLAEAKRTPLRDYAREEGRKMVDVPCGENCATCGRELSVAELWTVVCRGCGAKLEGENATTLAPGWKAPEKNEGDCEF